MKKSLPILAALVCFALGTLRVEGAVPPEGGFRTTRTPEECDSLISTWYESAIYDSYETYLHDFIDIDLDEDLADLKVDQIPDSVYEARLRMIASVIQLPYNDIVRRYIIAYTGRMKGQMQRMLGMAQYYFPFIEEELDRQGIPSEFKILPMIESGLSAKAVSRAGATGLWQFMLRTGKGMGLEINSFVDERMDPVASTRAACAYLKQLYDIYGDWTLVIAAYNCGPGNVNKGLKRAPNARTYWDIYEYLPRETRGYVPGFIAATYAYTFHKAHGMEPVAPPLPLSVDTVTIHKMTHFGQISETIGVPVDILREMNPHYKLDIVPATDKSYTMLLPQQLVTAFVEREPEIYAKDTLYLQQYIAPANFASKTGNDRRLTTPRRTGAGGAINVTASGTTYRVQSGDVIGSIARRFGVTTAALMQLNNIRDPRRLQIGQVLKIPK